MLVSLRLQNVRSYTDSSFEFEPGVTIIVGPNASGKTTILESIIVSYTGSSFKARDAELVRAEAPWLRVDAQIDRHSRVFKLVRQEDNSFLKEYVFDDTKQSRMSSARQLGAVLFEPNDLLLLHGSPEGRRQFLDTILSYIDPGYGTALRQYKRVLLQRNSLLKQYAPHKKDQLFVWNLRLSELGGFIAQRRLNLTQRFNGEIAALYSSVAGKETEVSVALHSKLNLGAYESSLLQALERTLELDIARGFTGSGPHRDDMVCLLYGKPAQETASRGEIRTLVLALKMLEAQFIEAYQNQKPLLLLDDVFSELDGKRRQALVQFLGGYQAFITTTDADVVLEHFLGKANVIALD